MNSIVTLTVFTPAFNRAHTLVRTYESLKKQTCKDFCWLIIDDGSTDNTADLVKQWQNNAENGFEIIYVYKENQGMHSAHNVAYSVITSELNVCIDSDDYMPENAVEIICQFWKKNGSDNVAGIIALDADVSGRILGTELPKDIKDVSTTDLYEVFKAKGDKKFIYRTDIINSVPPYPIFPGEKLVPLGYKYNLVAMDYTMLLLNEIVCFVDYQEDGSTNSVLRQYMQSPKGFAAQCLINMQYSKRLSKRIKSAIHYVAECRIANDHQCIKKTNRKMLTVAIYPIGVLSECIIRLKNYKYHKAVSAGG